MTVCSEKNEKILMRNYKLVTDHVYVSRHGATALY